MITNSNVTSNLGEISDDILGVAYQLDWKEWIIVLGGFYIVGNILFRNTKSAVTSASKNRKKKTSARKSERLRKLDEEYKSRRKSIEDSWW